MARSTDKAREIINAWRQEHYAHGIDVLGKTGEMAKLFGNRALLVLNGVGHDWAKDVSGKVTASLRENGVTFAVVPGARPNAPREDVYRIANAILQEKPDSIVAVGGGSTIDAVKCASVLAAYDVDEVVEHLGADRALASTVEPFFGVGNVTKIVDATGKKPIPVVAVETVSSSGAHLTKYSNVTDPLTSQKKLIVDMAIVPPKAVFDYSVTALSPRDLTLDGGLDGISHLWEVFMGATGKSYHEQVSEIAVEGISLIVENLPKALNDPMDIDARAALGYGTDLGGYAIMIGGTNGGHLGSFSLVDVLSHGRACAILNPYYTVLFALAIQNQLRTVGAIFKKAGFIKSNLNRFEGRKLAEVVAEGMISFLKSIGFPVTLSKAGASKAHIKRMIEAAKNPQLESKLKNMPIPMDPSRGDVDIYMKSAIRAAYYGNISLIRMMPYKG